MSLNCCTPSCVHNHKEKYIEGLWVEEEHDVEVSSYGNKPYMVIEEGLRLATRNDVVRIVKELGGEEVDTQIDSWNLPVIGYSEYIEDGFKYLVLKMGGRDDA